MYRRILSDYQLVLIIFTPDLYQPLSPFMMTHILEPTHLSMSSDQLSVKNSLFVTYKCAHSWPNGRSCDAMVFEIRNQRVAYSTLCDNFYFILKYPSKLKTIKTAERELSLSCAFRNRSGEALLHPDLFMSGTEVYPTPWSPILFFSAYCRWQYEIQFVQFPRIYCRFSRWDSSIPCTGESMYSYFGSVYSSQPVSPSLNAHRSRRVGLQPDSWPQLALAAVVGSDLGR